MKTKYALRKERNAVVTIANVKAVFASANVALKEIVNANAVKKENVNVIAAKKEENAKSILKD